MTDRLYVDIETYSSVDLKQHGAYKYAASPDFMILMAGWSFNGSPVKVAVGWEEVARIPGLTDPKVIKVAHNAQFERVCFSAAFGLPLGVFLAPEEWHDTQAVAGEKGYPQKLENLAVALGASEKDSAGTRLISIFCKPNRKGTRTLPEEKPDEWLEFIMYCHQDVVTLIEVDQKLGDFPTETERQVFFADQHINDRGLLIDVELAKHARAAALANQELQIGRQIELTGLENPNSVPQLSGWLKGQGVKLPNLKEETVTKLLAGNLDPEVREVLQLRQELALAAPAKFGAALAAVLPDNRLRGTIKFFGAHTGRWAGRGTQPHNLPRLNFTYEDKETGKKTWDEAAEKEAILDLLMDEGATSKTLKKLVRPMFLLDGTVVDYSAIEAVVISWLAEEEWVLEAFRQRRDIYVENAARMGGLTRPQGKIAVLALNYNGGPGSLRAMAEDDDVYTPKGSSEPKRIKDSSDEELYSEFVYPYREANRRIVRLWKMLDNRFVAGGKVGPHLYIEADRADRLIHLPSGRQICYRQVSSRRDSEGRQRLTFKSPMGYRTDTYGGRLAENVTQAVARDLLAEGLVRLRENGFSVVAHVHDEILVEKSHDVEKISEIMTELPSWAEGMPVYADGFTCHRYRKG